MVGTVTTCVITGELFPLLFASEFRQSLIWSKMVPNRSNFEIGALDFYRSDAYRSYFKYLDDSGGFFYERWGDGKFPFAPLNFYLLLVRMRADEFWERSIAPVHSIAAALLLKPEEMHYFSDIGYRVSSRFSKATKQWNPDWLSAFLELPIAWTLPTLPCRGSFPHSLSFNRAKADEPMRFLEHFQRLCLFYENWRELWVPRILLHS